jgi:hypothetical protein
MRLLTKEKLKRFNRDTYRDIFVCRHQMSNWRWKLAIAAIISVLQLNSAAAQSQPTVPQSSDQSSLLSTVYVPPYDLLRQHNALERIKEILSPADSQSN